MHRFLIAAASAALIISSAAPALAQQDYPPCTSPTQDHCREAPMRLHGSNHHHHKMHGNSHHYSKSHHHETKGKKVTGTRGSMAPSTGASPPLVGGNPQH